MAEPTLKAILIVYFVLLSPLWSLIPFVIAALWRHYRSDEVAKRHGEGVHERAEARRPRYAAALRSNARRHKLSRR
jgi:hypothetical protein